MSFLHFAAVALGRLAASNEGCGIIADQTWQLDVQGGKSVRREFTVRVTEKTALGRHIFIISGKADNQPDESDSFIAVDVN